MPFNPIEMLKKAGSWATSPVISEETAKPYIDQIDAPAEFRSPMEARMRGFTAGAAEGARNLLTPLNIGLMAASGPVGGMFRGAGQAARAAAPTMDLIEEAPAIKQVAGSMDDVNSLIGDMQRNLARIPKRGAAPALPNGALTPVEHVAQGAESAYNAARPAVAQPPNPMDGVYRNMMQKFATR